MRSYGGLKKYFPGISNNDQEEHAITTNFFLFPRQKSSTVVDVSFFLVEEAQERIKIGRIVSSCKGIGPIDIRLSRTIYSVFFSFRACRHVSGTFQPDCGARNETSFIVPSKSTHPRRSTASSCDGQYVCVCYVDLYDGLWLS